MTDSEDRILQEQEEETPKVVGMGRRRSLSPIPRETLHDRVYAELRRSLIHGVFATGETLRIQELAERLQTSTMPVREALARLVSEQALEALPNRSVRVPVITRERLEDLARARTLIEGQIVALALPNLKPTDFAHLRQLAGQCEAAFRSQESDRARITSEFNHAFHYYIYRAARSAVLIPIIESLWLQSGPYVQAAAALHEEQRDLPGAHHHWALIEAMERGDEQGAISALRDDISRSFNLVRQRLDAEEAERMAANDD
ncbi:GntR family transcriptional regulator [Dongia deserti]|uniref:GntR family transcriptional regulator n=1 Tax=Dongia deserti TaxID=2268030 RepID=UPI0025483AFB|nr:GntR family transcriptional regulator [Dongia deserti]